MDKDSSTGQATSEEAPGPLPTVETFWSTVEYNGYQQRFLVCRLGSSGSAFLAKLLNAHPEVFCSHEGILANRAYSSVQHSDLEQQNFLAYICSDSLHGAYKASGDVGSAWIGYLLAAPKTFPIGNTFSTLVTAVLHRHPLSVLNTKLRVSAHDPRVLSTNVTEELSRYFSENSIPCDVEFITDLEDRSFIWNCYQWRSAALNGVGLDVTIQVEEMRRIDYALEKLHALTGLEYEVDLVQSLIGVMVNSRSGSSHSPAEIYASLDPAKQHWYRSIVEEPAVALGYQCR